MPRGGARPGAGRPRKADRVVVQPDPAKPLTEAQRARLADLQQVYSYLRKATQGLMAGPALLPVVREIRRHAGTLKSLSTALERLERLEADIPTGEILQ